MFSAHFRQHSRTRRRAYLRQLLVQIGSLGLLLLVAACSLPGSAPGRGHPTQSGVLSPTPTPTPTPRPVEQYGFQKGIVYPGWSSTSYGVSDSRWQGSLEEIKESTGAQWLEMPILLSQPAPESVDIAADAGTPTVEAFTSGVRKAHEAGFKVFLAPLLTVRQPGGWAALITPGPALQQSWFDHYWRTLKPYLVAAEANGVEQVALATEMEWLQSNAPASLWHQLIRRVRSIYTGNLTYDINWSTLDEAPDWLRDRALTFIGVSEYISLTNAPVRLDGHTLLTLWHDVIKVRLDSLARRFHKRIILTEIGYRNSADALYQAWSSTSDAPEDPQEQADAYNAALANVIPDREMAGIFFWGWDDVARFGIKGEQAARVLHEWYSTDR